MTYIKCTHQCPGGREAYVPHGARLVVQRK